MVTLLKTNKISIHHYEINLIKALLISVDKSIKNNERK